MLGRGDFVDYDCVDLAAFKCETSCGAVVIGIVFDAVFFAVACAGGALLYADGQFLDVFGRGNRRVCRKDDYCLACVVVIRGEIDVFTSCIICGDSGNAEIELAGLYAGNDGIEINIGDFELYAEVFCRTVTFSFTPR